MSVRLLAPLAGTVPPIAAGRSGQLPLADVWHGLQSALAPAGTDAQQIATLFWWMAGGAAIIWLIMVGLGVYSVLAHHELRPRGIPWLVIGGGAAVPSIVLGVLLAYGLAKLPHLVRPAPEGSLVVEVRGEQWWWRVAYPDAEADGGQRIELANEIHLPVGRPVEFRLISADVIHAFWIPSLGGKIDMFPGRETRLVLEPTQAGIYQGVCAEFCGESHAHMAFPVIVESEAEFADWLGRQRDDAREPDDDSVRRGREIFLSNGCGACHAIRGTPARGRVGPDLTHLGGRHSLAAGRLPNDPAAIERWIARPQQIKPDVNMPAFDFLQPEELEALAKYLHSLK